MLVSGGDDTPIGSAADFDALAAAVAAMPASVPLREVSLRGTLLHYRSRPVPWLLADRERSRRASAEHERVLWRRAAAQAMQRFADLHRRTTRCCSHSELRRSL